MASISRPMTWSTRPIHMTLGDHIQPRRLLPSFLHHGDLIIAKSAHRQQKFSCLSLNSPRSRHDQYQPRHTYGRLAAPSLNRFDSPSLRTRLTQQQRLFTRSACLLNAKPPGTKEEQQQQQPSIPKPSPIKLNSANPSEAATAVPQIFQRLTPPVVHENIYTLPNFLTTTRVITAPIISWALLTSQPVLAFSLFAYSSITDLVDGWLARRFNSGTVLGSILDPFADKLLMTLTTISLYSIGTFPWWLALVILGRDGGLLLSALYFRWISLPPPRTMTRYWDFSLPSAEVRPTEISKINTLLQFLLVADAVLLPVLPVSLVETWNLWGVLEGWMGLVAGTTIWSGLSYIFAKDAIRFVGRDQAAKK